MLVTSRWLSSSTSRILTHALSVSHITLHFSRLLLFIVFALPDVMHALLRPSCGLTRCVSFGNAEECSALFCLSRRRSALSTSRQPAARHWLCLVISPHCPLAGAASASRCRQQTKTASANQTKRKPSPHERPLHCIRPAACRRRPLCRRCASRSPSYQLAQKAATAYLRCRTRSPSWAPQPPFCCSPRYALHAPLTVPATEHRCGQQRARFAHSPKCRRCCLRLGQRRRLSDSVRHPY